MLMDLDTALGFAPLVAEGFLRTLWLTAATLACGAALALPVAACRNAARRGPRLFAYAFVFVFRGAPLLVLLFLIYYGSPEIDVIRDTALWGLFREPVFCAVLALSLNSAGYLSEIVAGAVRGVPRGELDAATAAGLPRRAILAHVVFPNAMRTGLRAYANEVTFVVKGTSVASLVTIIDLMASANQIYYRTFDPVTPLAAAGALYLLLVLVLGRAVAALERRFERGVAGPAGRRASSRVAAPGATPALRRTPPGTLPDAGSGAGRAG